MMSNSGKGKQSPKKSAAKLKHNGKVKTSKISFTNSTPVEEDSPSTRERGVLTIPLIRTVDNPTLLPSYHTIFKRAQEDVVKMQELFNLQWELENLLTTVVIRHRVVQDETVATPNTEDNKNKKGRLGVHKPPLSPGKRSKNVNKPLKKLKDNLSKVKSDSPTIPLTINVTKVKGISLNSSSSSSLNFNPIERDPPDSSEMDVPEILPPKNDTPIRFWSSVEPYCAAFTIEDVKLLEDLINDHEIDEFQKIPPLGKHYSLKWAQEDLMEEQEAGNQNKVKGNISDANSMLKRAEKLNETPATGPLTQRLISALMEENIMVPIQDTPDSKKCRGGENQTPRTGLLNNFSLKNSLAFEKRIRKELEEQGILDPNEQIKNPAEDEIMTELKACQAELKTLSSHNVSQLKRLLDLTKKEMAKQDLKRQLQSIDNDILEIYKKISSKQGDKLPSDKEQEQAWALLRERELLIRQIDLKEENMNN